MSVEAPDESAGKSVGRLPPPRRRDRVAAAVEMWRDYILSGLPPARPRLLVEPEPLVAEAVFVITSVIRPARPVIAYRWTRSVFDPDQRLAQTLGTIESIRTRVPGAAIVLVEASSLGDDEWQELASRVERPIRIDHDPRAVRLRDSLSRAAGEAYMLLAAQPQLRMSTYELAIKVSGRYQLTEGFDLDRLPRDRIALTKLSGEAARDPRGRSRLTGYRIVLSPAAYSNVHGTRMYSVPSGLRSLWEQQLRKALRAGLRGQPMEVALVRTLPEDSYLSLEHIGLTGELAITGGRIDD